MDDASVEEQKDMSDIEEAEEKDLEFEGDYAHSADDNCRRHSAEHVEALSL